MTDMDMNKISPDKIQSINVLKGESAKVKYAEKGANGVVEITTKKP
jgi:TonB-dependent SusC/RagA subfamily outer membrane receptor